MIGSNDLKVYLWTFVNVLCVCLCVHQVTIGYKKPRTYPITPGRKRLVKALARNSLHAITQNLFQNAAAKKLILKEIGRLLHNEVVTMCSDQVNSVLRSKSAESLPSFSWSVLIAELKKHAPILLTVLSNCTKTPSQKDATPVIGLCAAVIMKFRRPSMSLVQRILSIVLFAGHAKKEVMTKTGLYFVSASCFSSHRSMFASRSSCYQCLTQQHLQLLTNFLPTLTLRWWNGRRIW